MSDDRQRTDHALLINARVSRQARPVGGVAAQYGFLALALLVWIAPVAAEVVQNVWSTDQGAQGPLILVSGAWLLWMTMRDYSGLAHPGRTGPATGALLGCALLFFLGRLVDMLSVELLSAWLVLVVLLYAYVGTPLLRRLAFPLGYLLFLIPPPFFIMFPLTRALKLWIASRAVALSAASGIEVAGSGGTIFVDQYELTVEAACAGLNSLFSLLAIGTFYVYLRHGGNRRYAALLIAAIVPIAIGANLIRVLLLTACVHFFGSAILDTALHVTIGLATALSAMILLVALDTLASPIERRLRPATTQI